MRTSNHSINTRRNNIMELVSEHQNISAKTLSEMLDVSLMTIRRDLAFLDEKGFIERTHGGAKKKESNNNPNQSYASIITIEKIAKKAAEYIEEQSTIFINSSTTALLSIKYAQDKVFTIITNNLKIDADFINPKSSIILTGGEIRYPKNALVGDIANNTLNTISANKAIIGCSGISAEKGITTNNIHEAKVNQQMVSHTNELVIVVASHEKVGKDTNFIVCDVSFIDILITDKEADKEELQKFEEAGVKVITV